MAARHYRVTINDVFEAHEQALAFGGLPGVKDINLVHSAIGRPYSGYHKSLPEKAAAITESLSKNHGFVDGNKRTAFLIALLLVERSNHVFVNDAIGVELEELIVACVEKKVGFEQLVQWFRERTAPL